MDSAQTEILEQNLRADLRDQVAWVDRLARRLVSDPDLAADVAQDAWVRVLRRPPQDTSNVARLRAWLRRVVSSAAIDSARSAKRRGRREAAVARPDRSASTLDVVERLAARRRVIEAVLQLDEPYRTTVLLRHFDALDTATIARQMDVSAAVVRKRLSRGLSILRGRLGSGSAGDNITCWVAGLFAFKGHPSGGVAMANAVTAAVITKVGLSLLIVAGLTMTGAWVLDSDENPTAQPVAALPAVSPQPTVVSAPTALGAFASGAPEPLQVSAPVVAGPDDKGQLSPPAPATVLLTLQTVDERGGPIAGVEVRSKFRQSEPWWTDTSGQIEPWWTDAKGQIEIPVAAGSVLDLLLKHERFLIERLEIQIPGELTIDTMQSETFRPVVVLREGSAARVAVTDTKGAPIGGATVRLRDMHDLTADGTILGTATDLARSDFYTGLGGTDIRESTTGDDGIASLRGLRPGTYQLRVWADRFSEHDQTDLGITSGLNDLGVVQLSDAVLVQGVVLGPGGPVEGARVELMPTAGGEYATVDTNAMGEFKVHTLSAYPAENRLKVSHDGHDTLCASNIVLDEQPLVLELRARSVARLLLIDPTLGTPIHGDVMVSREYTDSSLLLPAAFAKRVSTQAGEVLIDGLESCLHGVLLKVDGFPRTWVSRDQLQAATHDPLTIFLEGKDLVLLVVTDLTTGEILSDTGLKLGYKQSGPHSISSSTTWHGEGSGTLFDPVLGGFPLDVQQLRLGRYADNTQIMWVAAIAEGYLPGKQITLVKNGELVRRGEVHIRLERESGG